MTAIEVARLKLRCTAEQRDRARFAIEDGLRTSIPDNRRLVLLRKMQIGREASSMDPALRHAAVHEGWLSAIAGARHGGHDSAADANCVWFASYEEAETLLLTRLLAGRSVDAWFWKLAVPMWRERPLRVWTADCLSEAIGRGEDRRILALVQCFIAAGSGERLIETLAGPIRMTAPDAAGPASLQQPPSANSTHDQELAAEAGPIARTLVASLPPGLIQLIKSLVRTGEQARMAARAILRAWILKQSPALSLSPSLLADVSEAAIGGCMTAVAPDVARRPPVQADARMEFRLSSQSPELQPPPDAVGRPRPLRSGPMRRAMSAEPDGIAPQQSQPDPSISNAATPGGHRLYSAHAGLWLAVPSLIDLGFPQWLERRPSLLGENPGGQLLHDIAGRYRVAPDDPALMAIGDVPNAGAPPEWRQLWRKGLDGWLRRKARRRLHDLVNRPGELDCSEWGLIIHYPAADADLALRRLALDRDPGWTGWLGLSIRYAFGGREDWV